MAGGTLEGRSSTVSLSWGTSKNERDLGAELVGRTEADTGGGVIDRELEGFSDRGPEAVDRRFMERFLAINACS